MGLLGKLFGKSQTTAIASPWSGPNDLAEFAQAEIFGDIAAAGIVTRAQAKRVPGMKRALDLHTGIVAGLNFEQRDGDTVTKEQPAWLTSSASGLSPYLRWYGVTADLFWNAWACLGFTADMSDCIHIPYGLWGVDETGTVKIDPSIATAYRARPVAIPLGYDEAGVLVDARDTIIAARTIERVWMQRVKNPAPATELHITDSQYDNMTRRERRRIVKNWNAERQLDDGQTALTQSFIEVKGLGQTSADLFEKGRNASRLDIANHTSLPASLLEGARDGGGSDINYSNDAGKRNELYDFGSKRYVQAIEARLSLDDVCAPGLSIRADLSNLMAFPSPDSNSTSED